MFDAAEVDNVSKKRSRNYEFCNYIRDKEVLIGMNGPTFMDPTCHECTEAIRNEALASCASRCLTINDCYFTGLL